MRSVTPDYRQMRSFVFVCVTRTGMMISDEWYLFVCTRHQSSTHQSQLMTSIDEMDINIHIRVASPINWCDCWSHRQCKWLGPSDHKNSLGGLDCLWQCHITFLIGRRVWCRWHWAEMRPEVQTSLDSDLVLNRLFRFRYLNTCLLTLVRGNGSDRLDRFLCPTSNPGRSRCLLVTRGSL